MSTSVAIQSTVQRWRCDEKCPTQAWTTSLVPTGCLPISIIFPRIATATRLQRLARCSRCGVSTNGGSTLCYAATRECSPSRDSSPTQRCAKRHTRRTIASANHGPCHIHAICIVHRLLICTVDRLRHRVLDVNRVTRLGFTLLPSITQLLPCMALCHAHQVRSCVPRISDQSGVCG